MVELNMKESLINLYSFDITPEIKKNIIEEYKLFSLTISESLREYLKKEFEESKIPSKSLSRSLLLAYSDIIAIQNLINNDYWLISEKQLPLEEILYFFRHWFNTVNSKKLSDNIGINDFTWQIWEPYNKNYYILPYYLMKQIEGKEIKIAINFNEKESRKKKKKNDEKSELKEDRKQEKKKNYFPIIYSIKFIREIPEIGIHGMKMISNIIIKKIENEGSNTQVAYSFELQLKIDTNPEKDEKLTFLMGIRRYSNRDIENTGKLRWDLNPRINIIPKSFDRPAISIRMKREKNDEKKWEWTWDNVLESVTNITGSLLIQIPKPIDAIKFERLTLDQNGYLFGLVHSTQDFFLHKVMPGISVGEKASFLTTRVATF